MPPFQYRSPDFSGYVGSIGDLLARNPYGPAVASGLQQVGATVAAIPEQQRAERRAAKDDEARDIELRRARAAEKLGPAILAHTKTMEDGHLLYDVDGFRQSVQADPDLAPIAPDALRSMQAGNDTYQQWREGRFATKNAALQGIYAKAAEAGGTPDDLTVIAMPFVRGGVLAEDDLGQMMKRLIEIPDQAARVTLLRAAGGVKRDLQSVVPGGTIVDTANPGTPLFTAPNPAEERLAEQARLAAADREADNKRADAQLEVSRGQLDVARTNASRDRAPQAKEVLNDAGQPVMANYSDGVYVEVATGQPIKNPKPIPSAAETQDARKFKQADPILRSVTELSERINTQQGLLAKMSGGVEKVKAQANYNDDVAEYEALVSGFTPLVARALGHTGVLTQQDVDSVKALFPKPGESKSLRDRKITRIKSIIGELEATAGGDTAPRVSEPPTAVAATAPKLGDVVTVRGQKVRVSKVNKDGTYEGMPVP